MFCRRTQPILIACPKTPATIRGNSNLDILLQIHYNHSELPSNFIDLNLPSTYLPRLCSYFSLYYKNDIPSQHNYVSKYIILKDPDRSK